MAYHHSVVLALSRLLEVTSQQLLPGTTTLRNGVSFLDFRNDLKNSLIKSINFMIDNQETSSIYNGQFSGLFKEFKNNKNAIGNNPPVLVDNRTSAPHGKYPLILSYINMKKLNILKNGDLNRLLTLIYSLAENTFGITSDGGWGRDEWRTAVMMNWSFYISSVESFGDSGEMALLNSSFEDIEITWELWSWDEYGVEVSDDEANSGTNALYILDESNNHSKWGSLVVTANEFIDYKVEVYAHIMSGFQSIYMNFLDFNFQLLESSYIIASSNSGFTKKTMIRTAPNDTKYLRIVLYAPWFYSSEGYWDDVTLTQLTEKSVSMNNSQNVDDYSNEVFPNPFNPSTKIVFNLPNYSWTEIKIYDIPGNEVNTLVSEFLEKGRHEVLFDGTNLSSGTYIYSIRRGDHISINKIMLIK